MLDSSVFTWTFLGPFLVQACWFRWSDRTGRIPQSRNLPGCSSEAGRAAYLPSHLSFLHIPAVISSLLRSSVFKTVLDPLYTKYSPPADEREWSSHAKPYTPLAQIYFVWVFVSPVLLPIQRFTSLMWSVKIYIHSFVFKRNNLVRNVSHSHILHILRVLKKGKLNDEVFGLQPQNDPPDG